MKCKPWSANRELGTFNLQNCSVSVHSLHFMVCAPLKNPKEVGFANFRGRSPRELVFKPERFCELCSKLLPRTPLPLVCFAGANAEIPSNTKLLRSYTKFPEKYFLYFWSDFCALQISRKEGLFEELHVKFVSFAPPPPKKKQWFQNNFSELTASGPTPKKKLI